MKEEKNYYDKNDVAIIVNCSVAKAYNIIRALNLTLMKENNLDKSSIRWGRVSKKFFHERTEY